MAYKSECYHRWQPQIGPSKHTTSWMKVKCPDWALLSASGSVTDWHEIFQLRTQSVCFTIGTVKWMVPFELDITQHPSEGIEAWSILHCKQGAQSFSMASIITSCISTHLSTLSPIHLGVCLCGPLFVLPLIWSMQQSSDHNSLFGQISGMPWCQFKFESM